MKFTTRSIGLLSIAVTCIAAVSISISSCDSNSTPTTPGNGGVDRSKNPRVLDGPDAVAIGSTTSGIGQASVRYDESSSLIIQGLDGVDANYAQATFDDPINTWNATVDATIAEGNGALYFEARDVDGNLQARVDLRAQGSSFETYPTFTSDPEHGEAQYQVTFYNGTTVVGGPFTLGADERISITADADCLVKTNLVGWKANFITGQCLFNLQLDPCCTYTFTLPNGTQYTGNGVKFTELNAAGVYVYVNTGSIRTGGTFPAGISNAVAVKAATAFTAN